MNVNGSSVPTTGKILRFFVRCFGEGIDKGVSRPKGSKSKTKRATGNPDSAQYKRIERLVKQRQQRKDVSREIENALIDAVAALFGSPLNGESEARKIREMKFSERIHFALSPSCNAKDCGPRLDLALVFWIVYFVDHHEWLRPQLEQAHAPGEALWQWVMHATHLYTNTFVGSVRANPSVLSGLPRDLSWNMPVRQSDGSIKWPMCHALEWLESLLADPRELPFILYRNQSKSHSIKSFMRLKRGKQLPSLTNIKSWAETSWKFNEAVPPISAEKIKVIFLWCRALEFALKAVEKRFHLDSVWLLVDWHNRAVASWNVKLSQPIIVQDGDISRPNNVARRPT